MSVYERDYVWWDMSKVWGRAMHTNHSLSIVGRKIQKKPDSALDRFRANLGFNVLNQESSWSEQ